MPKSKRTKRSLIASMLAMCVCIAMFAGATFAWFTDTASTSANKIQAGNLNVVLMYEDANGQWQNAEGATLGWVQATNAEGSTTQIVDAEGQPLWEPGATFTLPKLKVVNEGDLAFKYKVQITGITGDAKLNDVIDWKMNLDSAEETLGTEHNLAAKTTEATDSDVFTVSGTMQTTASNDYQGLSIDGISITIVATQLESEFDSAGNKYDADATYPVVS